MQPEVIFSFANTFVLIGWVLLVVASRWKYTIPLVRYGAVLVLSVLYAVLIITHIGDSEGDFNSLAGVAQLFENPWSLLAGWVHYLAFDLFLGSWEVENSRALGIPHWLVIPCLLFTFLLGPVGLLLYLLLRAIYTKRLSYEPA